MHRRVQGEPEAQRRGEQRERAVEAEALTVGRLVEAREQVLDGDGVDVGDGAPVEAHGVIEDLCAQVPGELEVVEAGREGEGRAGGHAWGGDRRRRAAGEAMKSERSGSGPDGPDGQKLAKASLSSAASRFEPAFDRGQFASIAGPGADERFPTRLGELRHAGSRGWLPCKRLRKRKTRAPPKPGIADVG